MWLWLSPCRAFSPKATILIPLNEWPSLSPNIHILQEIKVIDYLYWEEMKAFGS